MTGGLLQLSGVVVDLVHHVARLPAPGEEVETSSFAMTAGGGFNAMAAARRMGIAVVYGGVLGTGDLAEIARRCLAAEGIGLADAGQAEIDQGSCAVIVDGTGERSFISHHGAEREVELAHLMALPAASCSFALLTGYSLYKPRSAAAFLAWLPQLPAATRLLFDPGPIVAEIPRERLDAVLVRADWVSCNAREAQVLTGEREPAKAAIVLAAGRAGALVRRGGEGCWLAHGGSVAHLPGFKVGAIDTNGAGDCHDGAFIAALVRGFGAKDAAVIANAAAAISTTRSGPATAPDDSETRRFLAARGVMLAAPENWETGATGHSRGPNVEDRQ